MRETQTPNCWLFDPKQHEQSLKILVYVISTEAIFPRYFEIKIACDVIISWPLGFHTRACSRSQYRTTHTFRSCSKFRARTSLNKLVTSYSNNKTCRPHGEDQISIIISWTRIHTFFRNWHCFPDHWKGKTWFIGSSKLLIALFSHYFVHRICFSMKIGSQDVDVIDLSPYVAHSAGIDPIWQRRVIYSNFAFLTGEAMALWFI